MQNISGSHSCNKRGDKTAGAGNHATLAGFGGCLKTVLVGGDGERMKTMEWKKAFYELLLEELGVS